MKFLRTWHDLKPLGIESLTGEACGLSYRILCDVTEAGRRIVGKCLGIPDLALSPPWNRGSQTTPHVGSILLVPEMFVPLGVFALLESGCSECWQHQRGELLGIESGDAPEQVESYRTMYRDVLVRKFAYQGTAGDRNIHVMSGRVT